MTFNPCYQRFSFPVQNWNFDVLVSLLCGVDTQISDCRNSRVTDFFFGFYSHRKLNNNNILEFDLSVNLTNLVQLNLNNNDIYKVRHLHLAGNLTNLDLSYNQLKNLASPGDNQTWPSSLTKLRLNHNRIANISKETFKAMSSLQTL